VKAAAFARGMLRAMRIAILGCTRGVGAELLAQALEAGHEVVAIARRPEAIVTRHERLRVCRGSAEDAGSLAEAIAGTEAVVCAVGAGGLRESRKPTTLYSTAAASLVEAMKRSGVPRLVAVTAGGVVPSPDWPWFYRRIIHPMLREMYRDMERMESIIRASGVRHLFVRPARLTGGRRTGVYRATADIMPPGGSRISRADVADYILRRLSAGDFEREAFGIAA